MKTGSGRRLGRGRLGGAWSGGWAAAGVRLRRATVWGLVLAAVGGATAAEPCDPARLAEANNRFALELYGRVAQAPGNLFFSPYSVVSALAMTHGGARGATAAQMERALHFPAADEALHAGFAALRQRLAALERVGGVELAVANSLWPERTYTFLPSYLERMRECYGVAITPLDYRGDADGARRTINAWVEERTRNRIQNLISSLDSLTRMVLVNAVYFKGRWHVQFDPKATKEEPFCTSAERAVSAPLMTFRPPAGGELPEFGYWENERLQVLELPYVGQELAMVVLLPRARDGLPELERSLSAVQLADWTGGLNSRRVRVYLPKFKFTWGAVDLTAPLMALGMTDAFDPATADFSGMTGPRADGDGLHISQVLHKAFVEVNEEGTEAAAATAVVMRALALPEPEPVFRADHPFLFLIRERRTGLILFLGRLAEPAAAK